MPTMITPLPNVIVPIFRSDGFDAEATQNLGKADDIAWSGRIVARTGLRMMPTFPRSPLTFRKASFPRYG